MNIVKSILIDSEISKNVTIGIILLWVSTLIHHLYGAIIYSTIWRVIAPVLIFPIILIITLWVLNKLLITKSRKLQYLFFIIVLIFWIVPIGFIEGGYGHFLKNILFYTGTDTATLHKLFPAEFGNTRFFENPNDYFFEISGISQFFIGLYTFYYLVKFIRKGNK